MIRFLPDRREDDDTADPCQARPHARNYCVPAGLERAGACGAAGAGSLVLAGMPLSGGALCFAAVVFGFRLSFCAVLVRSGPSRC